MSTMATRRCSTCGGRGCDQGCGTCEYANAGPDSHKVCRACGGSGVEHFLIGDVEEAVFEPNPTAAAAGEGRVVTLWPADVKMLRDLAAALHDCAYGDATLIDDLDVAAVAEALRLLAGPLAEPDA